MTGLVNHRPVLAPSLARLPALGAFTLFDVGASRGIDEIWNVFGDALNAYGFEPLVAEVERLNATGGPHGKVRYFDAYIVRDADAHDDRAYALTDLIPRTSAARAMHITGDRYVDERFSAGKKSVLSGNRYSIDEFVRRENVKKVDFLKTDTDGFDYSVLLGAEHTLRGGVLGVAAEVFFSLPPHREANLFSNVDAYLRDLGFTLYDLDVRRYSKAALPGKFRYNIPASTLRGQVVWADVLYLRDFVGRSGDTEPPTSEQLLKMLCLFELFGLNDCAIELLGAFTQLLPTGVDAEQLRSVLAEEASGIPDYADYLRRFESAVAKGEYAAFPDGYVVRAEGYLMQNSAKPSEHTFRER